MVAVEAKRQKLVVAIFPWMDRFSVHYVSCPRYPARYLTLKVGDIVAVGRPCANLTLPSG